MTQSTNAYHVWSRSTETTNIEGKSGNPGQRLSQNICLNERHSTVCCGQHSKHKISPHTNLSQWKTGYRPMWAAGKNTKDLHTPICLNKRQATVRCGRQGKTQKISTHQSVSIKDRLPSAVGGREKHKRSPHTNLSQWKTGYRPMWAAGKNTKDLPQPDANFPNSGQTNPLSSWPTYTK